MPRRSCGPTEAWSLDLRAIGRHGRAMNVRHRSRSRPLRAIVGVTALGLVAATTGSTRATAQTPRPSAVAVGAQRLGLRLLGRSPLVAKGNPLLSPASIELALAMAHQGAKGRTASELGAVLGVSDLPSEAAQIAAELAPLSASRFTDAAGNPAKPTVQVVNGAFVQKDMTVEAAYRAALESFGAKFQALDFRSDPTTARQTMNAYVAEHTDQAIKELLPRDSIKDSTRVVLINAVHLFDHWSTPFDASLTKKRTFTTAAGKKVMADTMEQIESRQRYGAYAGWKALELRLQQSPARMVLLLPPKGTKALPSAATLERLLTSLGASPVTVNIRLPKWESHAARSMRADLSALGVHEAMTVNADFSGIHRPTDCSDNLYLQDVIHEARLEVDEEGTEASAATAVILAVPISAEPVFTPPPKPKQFFADHPFFAMVLTTSGLPLFQGVVNDPTLPPDEAPAVADPVILAC